MKVLDVDLLQDGLQRNITMLERLNTEIETIQRGVEGLVQMEDQLKGEGGNAIRSFYEECHLPFLQFFQLFSYDAQQVLYQIDKALNSLEPDLSGYILEEFLEGELEQGLTLIGQLTATLTDETNSIMDQVSDIVALPHLDDSAVQEGVISSKRKRDDTLSQLYEFDATQTTALNTMEQDIRTMETWLSDIEGMFKSGLTDVHFQADNWGTFTAKNNLKTELASRTSPIAVLSSIVNRENQLTTMLQSFIAGNGPIRFGYGGLIGIYNPFVGTDMIALSCSRPEGRGIEEKEIDQNIFVKSFHSFKGIAEDFWDGVRIRREKALDSPYDFVNYWTFGISDGIVSGADERSAKMFDSKLDFLNYATFGFSGMVKEAIFPEDPFSKEHWQNSFGFVGSIIGLRLAATPSPVKKPGNAAGDGKSRVEVENVTEGTSNASEGTSKSTGNGVATVSRQPVQIIQNRYPHEIQQGKTFEYVLENGQVKIRDGIKEVDFIIDINGNLKVGRGHSHLANEADVQAAGKLKVDANGNVRKLTNESGHYTPTAEQAKNYEQKIFNSAGIKTKNAWLEIYQLELTSNGYVDLAKLKKIQSTKLK